MRLSLSGSTVTGGPGDAGGLGRGHFEGKFDGFFAAFLDGAVRCSVGGWGSGARQRVIVPVSGLHI